MTDPVQRLEKLTGLLDALHGRTIKVALSLGGDLEKAIDARLNERERRAAMDERMNWE